MNITINAKQLRASLPKLVESARRGARYTVLYRSRRAFQIVPVDEADTPRGTLQADPLYRAKAVGKSVDGRPAADHGPPFRPDGVPALAALTGGDRRINPSGNPAPPMRIGLF